MRPELYAKIQSNAEEPLIVFCECHSNPLIICRQFEQTIKIELSSGYKGWTVEHLNCILFLETKL